MTAKIDLFNPPLPPKLPFLEAIAWQTSNVYQLTPEQMLGRYERGWRYCQIFGPPAGEEYAFLQALAQQYHSWLQADLMPFRLAHHNKILTILESFNPEVLKENFAYFGGGTLLTLELGEYRQSKDIDFICAINSPGYRFLRSLIFNGSYNSLFHHLDRIEIGRATADQYGIRLALRVEGEPIKTEIIAEARFDLDPPRDLDGLPVACLSWNDCFTSKLLANSDRYLDDSVDSRDLIDLAMLRLRSPLPPAAIAKAEQAYEVMRPLQAALERFQQREDYRAQCFLGLQIDPVQVPKIIDGIDRLAADFGLPPTQRTFLETHDRF